MSLSPPLIIDVKPWGRWATLGLGAVAVLAGQAVALTALIWWRGQGLAHLANIAGDGVVVTLVICISTPIEMLLLVLMAQRTRAGAANYLGFTLPRKRDLLWSIIAVVMLAVVGDLVSRLLGHNAITPFQLDIYRTAKAAGWLPWLWLSIVVVAPIGEETLFRGFLFRGWNRSPRDAWFAITATALLWSIIHVQYDFFVIAQVFVCGLVFGWFRWTSSSTILTMLLHGLLNFGGMVETFVMFRS